MGTLLKYLDIPDASSLSLENVVEILDQLKIAEMDDVLRDDEDIAKLTRLLNASALSILTTVFLAAGAGAEQQTAALSLVRKILQLHFMAGWREGVWHEKQADHGA